ncbi:MAG: helix-turn-helix domain-containing protein [Shinella sp.]|uniref:XRE family transcriptional regulator n=1 Tax=Shinella sp. TaxID=1870904 RepID=UPI003C788FEE
MADNIRIGERLRQAREAAGFKTAKAAAVSLGVSYPTYSQHENGTRGIVREAELYSRRYKVSLDWLMRGKGPGPGEDLLEPATVTDVPRISWVSAGELRDQDGVTDFSEYPTEPAIDLPEGEWICLEVEGNSMNKISPPESIIFVNLRDKRLVSNALYVVADESGATTYKRYRPNEEPQFQPASYEEVEPPRFQGAIRVIGRVRRSVINM